MEICKTPTLRLKALEKHTHIMCIEMENIIKNKIKILCKTMRTLSCAKLCEHYLVQDHEIVILCKIMRTLYLARSRKVILC